MRIVLIIVRWCMSIVLVEMLARRCAESGGESSAVIRERVEEARQVQLARFVSHPGVLCNADMGSRLVTEFCALDAAPELIDRVAPVAAARPTDRRHPEWRHPESIHRRSPRAGCSVLRSFQSRH
jgi:hypothetical protein